MTTFEDNDVRITAYQDSELIHFGILRKSGRYPWGSGDNPNQRNKQFLDYIAEMEAKGLKPTEIAKGIGMMVDPDNPDRFKTTQLRALKSIAKNEQRASDAAMALRLKEEGNSNVAIGVIMGRNESSIRALLDPAMRDKQDELITISNLLRKQVDEKKMIDVGVGVENQLGISATKLSTAVAILQEDGYIKYPVKVEQLGTGNITTLKILVPPDTPYSEVFKNRDNIQQIKDYSEDNGRTFNSIDPPVSVSSKRVAVRYAEDGGADKDGVIELRRGVEDLSLGQSRYAQVRIAVDGTHYLKGMAMYGDNLPDGVDMVFNTNKSDKGDKLKAMKPMKDDEDNPFGSTIRQKRYLDSKGKEKLSPLNIVGAEDPDGNKTPGEEGAWNKWSKNLSSQMLSKQSKGLAQQQLDLAYDLKKAEYDEIMSYTNPTVKKKLLESFADGADAAAVHLKAAGLPRNANHVILPINSLKDTEVYAPNYRNGEKVVLIRHPHGGKFEIPELTVNNRNAEAKRLIPGALDAVGINSKVAARLSGADFDGDTVLVIPNNKGQVKTQRPLEGLKNFDPQSAYPGYEGMKPMANKQTAMGDISNLITDMSIKGATDSELARAVRHSMVVIDAEKHTLNYRQSAQDNGIRQLKAKYQARPDGSAGGAGTIISRASGQATVAARKPRAAKDGGPIDAKTGRKVYTPTGETYVKRSVNAKGVVTEELITRTIKSTKMAETDDARSLLSSKTGMPIEAVYANHANKLKALANTARKDYLATPNLKYNKSAKAAYSKEVATLNAKLNVAYKNKPLERQAQIVANSVVKAKIQANPQMDSADIKKLKSQALAKARLRTGATKSRIDITPDEWSAIQAGAISNNLLKNILDNTDLDKVKRLATPRTATVMVPAKMARAKAMLAAGYDQSEVADALGVPVSTLNSALGR